MPWSTSVDKCCLDSSMRTRIALLNHRQARMPSADLSLQKLTPALLIFKGEKPKPCSSPARTLSNPGWQVMKNSVPIGFLSNIDVASASSDIFPCRSCNILSLRWRRDDESNIEAEDWRERRVKKPLFAWLRILLRRRRFCMRFDRGWK